KRLGKTKMQRVSDDAVYKGAQVDVTAINREIASRPTKGYAKGWTVEDTSISEPMWLNGKRTVKIHWNSSHGRYRIIHVKEHGQVTRRPAPRTSAEMQTVKHVETECKAVPRHALDGPFLATRLRLY